MEEFIKKLIPKHCTSDLLNFTAIQKAFVAEMGTRELVDKEKYQKTFDAEIVETLNTSIDDKLKAIRTTQNNKIEAEKRNAQNERRNAQSKSDALSREERYHLDTRRLLEKSLCLENQINDLKKDIERLERGIDSLERGSCCDLASKLKESEKKATLLQKRLNDHNRAFWKIGRTYL